MKTLDMVREQINTVFALKETRDGVLITTHYIYPSNSFIQVVVRGGQSSFYITDDGAAVREIEMAGAEIQRPDKLLRNLTMPRGLFIENGVIKSKFVGPREIPAVMALVANVSRECAEFLFNRARIKIQRDLKKLVSQYLVNVFEDRVSKDQVLIGKSNKPHKFENVVKLMNKRLIVDAVVYQQTAINARVLANLDVANAGYNDIEQRIIYDDQENWRAEDLNLLAVGSPVVAFSRAPEVLQRVATAN